MPSASQLLCRKAASVTTPDLIIASHVRLFALILIYLGAAYGFII